MSPRYLSPFRYPGGKARLGPYLGRLISAQRSRPTAYCEPFAGGFGAGLWLLNEGLVDDVLINDLNPGIAAFWRSLKNDGERLATRVETAAVTMLEWERQRQVYLNPSQYDDFELGYATFFLNRTNRSGILTARPIGGLSQEGRWKIDARFNGTDLARRIRGLAVLGPHMTITERDALACILDLQQQRENTLMYVDPPYVVKGNELYLVNFDWASHRALAEALNSASCWQPWVLTYDAEERVRALYADRRCAQFAIAHTAQTQHVGSEYMIFGGRLSVPDLQIGKTEGRWVHGARTGPQRAPASEDTDRSA